MEHVYEEGPAVNIDNRELHIKPEEWEKTSKKPEIVDLWCMFQKTKSGNHNDNRPRFNFKEAKDSGVKFYAWGIKEAGEVLAVRAALDKLNIKYHMDKDGA